MEIKLTKSRSNKVYFRRIVSSSRRCFFLFQLPWQRHCELFSGKIGRESRLCDPSAGDYVPRDDVAFPTASLGRIRRRDMGDYLSIYDVKILLIREAELDTGWVNP